MRKIYWKRPKNGSKKDGFNRHKYSKIYKSTKPHQQRNNTCKLLIIRLLMLCKRKRSLNFTPMKKVLLFSLFFVVFSSVSQAQTAKEKAFLKQSVSTHKGEEYSLIEPKKDILVQIAPKKGASNAVELIIGYQKGRNKAPERPTALEFSFKKGKKKRYPIASSYYEKQGLIKCQIETNKLIHWIRSEIKTIEVYKGKKRKLKLKISEKDARKIERAALYFSLYHPQIGRYNQFEHTRKTVDPYAKPPLNFGNTNMETDLHVNTFKEKWLYSTENLAFSQFVHLSEKEILIVLGYKKVTIPKHNWMMMYCFKKLPAQRIELVTVQEFNDKTPYLSVALGTNHKHYFHLSTDSHTYEKDVYGKILAVKPKSRTQRPSHIKPDYSRRLDIKYFDARK